jgi:hypothetical protein
VPRSTRLVFAHDLAENDIAHGCQKREADGAADGAAQRHEQRQGDSAACIRGLGKDHVPDGAAGRADQGKTNHAANHPHREQSLVG